MSLLIILSGQRHDFTCQLPAAACHIDFFSIFLFFLNSFLIVGDCSIYYQCAIIMLNVLWRFNMRVKTVSKAERASFDENTQKELRDLEKKIEYIEDLEEKTKNNKDKKIATDEDETQLEDFNKYVKESKQNIEEFKIRFTSLLREDPLKMIEIPLNLSEKQQKDLIAAIQEKEKAASSESEKLFYSLMQSKITGLYDLMKEGRPFEPNFLFTSNENGFVSEILKISDQQKIKAFDLSQEFIEAYGQKRKLYQEIDKEAEKLKVSLGFLAPYRKIDHALQNNSVLNMRDSLSQNKILTEEINAKLVDLGEDVAKAKAYLTEVRHYHDSLEDIGVLLTTAAKDKTSLSNLKEFVESLAEENLDRENKIAELKTLAGKPNSKEYFEKFLNALIKVRSNETHYSSLISSIENIEALKTQIDERDKLIEDLKQNNKANAPEYKKRLNIFKLEELKRDVVQDESLDEADKKSLLKLVSIIEQKLAESAPAERINRSVNNYIRQKKWAVNEGFWGFINRICTILGFKPQIKTPNEERQQAATAVLVKSGLFRLRTNDAAKQQEESDSDIGDEFSSASPDSNH